MKVVVVVVEGVSGSPASELNGRTALQVARLDHANRLAGRGVSGMVTVPGESGWHPVRGLAVCLGEHPEVVDTWEVGSVEALGIDWLIPGNWLVGHGSLITRDGSHIWDDLTGCISETETRALAQVLDEGLVVEGGRCRATGPGTVVVAWPAQEGKPPCLPEVGQVDNMRKFFAAHRDPSYDMVETLCSKAELVLQEHSVNTVRVDLRENPANGLWISHIGRAVHPDPSSVLRADVGLVADSPIARGVARLASVGIVPMGQIWGEEPGSPWKIQPTLIESLREWSHVVIVVPASMDSKRCVNPHETVKFLDSVDQVVLGPLFDVLDAFRPVRIVLLAGGGESGCLQVPVVMAGDREKADKISEWNEVACNDGALGSMNLDRFLQEIESG